MRPLPTLLPLLFAAACATHPGSVPGPGDVLLEPAEVAAEIVMADVIALGEEHMTPAVHRRHHELLRALHEKRPQMVIAMEMFERDVQGVLDRYLAGEIDEATFLAEARPWPHYARDYRPVIEFAKEKGLPVLAANAPRELARKAGREGAAAVAGNPHVARKTSAPEDAYWQAFQDSMKGHEGMFGPDGMKRFYEAQCLKDDTMAESIVDHLRVARVNGKDPLAVLICGKFHSDRGLGTVARVKSRMPELDVRVFTVQSLPTGIYRTANGDGAYTIVIGDKEPAAAAPAPAPAPKPAAEPVAAGTEPAPAEPAPAERNPEGMRPALGLLPAYGEMGAGLTVESVREGGEADKAGIQAGDVIVVLNGVKIEDVQHYSDVLDEQIIGKTITVRVRRGDAEVDLQVKVASRSR